MTRIYKTSFLPDDKLRVLDICINLNEVEILVYKEIVAEAKRLHTCVMQIPLIG
jgi:hypothetical protein